MALLEWRDEFSVGDPAVDHEHRELIDLVNRAAGAISAGASEEEIDRAFGDLLRAVSAHFAHEERQMRAASYDELAEHKADHERLIDALRDIMDGGAADAEAASEALVKVLGDWFTGHFASHDARLHRRLGPHHPH
ncbi:MAG: hemerythrin-like metal-binding protein [Alphaproteobacteria bacterium]|nr:MAG: hemerythrin-like metal-binding protein [Alphaproteobacteria bacterium]